MGRLLEGEGPSEQIAVVPGAGGDLEPEGKSAGIKAGGHDDRGHADHVHPPGIAVRAGAELAVLRHGLVGRRHLDGGIDVAVEMQAVEGAFVNGEGPAAGFEDVSLGLGIVFKTDLICFAEDGRGEG